MRIKKTYLSQKPAVGSARWNVILLFLFTLSSIVYWEGWPTSSLFSASREQIFSQHELWRLFTTLGIHKGIEHLGSNSLFFLIFGYLLNGYFGAQVFPFLSLILGAVTNAIVLLIYPPHSVLIGASGMVYAMAGFWIANYFFIERHLSVTGRILRILGVILILLIPQEFQVQVSYLAHATGFILGSLAGSIYFYFNSKKIRNAEVIETDEETENSDLEFNDWIEPTLPKVVH
jgi:rhomboid protease GluP